jgi:hypothetical protein
MYVRGGSGGGGAASFKLATKGQRGQANGGKVFRMYNKLKYAHLQIIVLASFAVHADQSAQVYSNCFTTQRSSWSICACDVASHRCVAPSSCISITSKQTKHCYNYIALQLQAAEGEGATLC